ncbi:diguanylate cyclase [Sphingobacterium sp. SRCM116780]|uniref:helix-turn-helix transcriptional regulator n=1 Tax=Sphingobacterium sp. SRCM116780 TaxID=2907623 RepID=UPI001F346112|nr:diguanylate cyclase [Sphingobacterium sp. SRCM116780]UIR56990.1 diguanylate cyclase [Sphingobacterium sp. SRCM116780]
MDKLEVLQAKMLNQYAFFASVIIMLNAVKDLFFGLFVSFGILSTTGFAFFFLFSRIRFKPLSLFICYVALILLIFYYSCLIGLESGVSTLYFPLLFSVLLVYTDRKNFRYSILIVLFVIIFFSINHFHNFRIFPSLSNESEEYLKNTRISIFIQAIGLVIIGGYFNLKKNEKLIKLFQQSQRSEVIISELKVNLDNTSNKEVEKLVSLAMENDIAFITLFKKVFPDFYDNLLKVNRDITPEEFRFCALLKLGFSTKDIAESNYLAIRTVQTRKSRLRKTFDIPPDTDLYVWINEF